MLRFIDTNPSFTLKIADREPQRTIDAYGYVMYRVNVSGWPYSLASVRHQITQGDESHPDGSYTVFCMSRRDIGLDLVETQTFTSRDEALAFVRETYIAALRLYEARATEVLEFIHADLSPVVQTSSRALPVDENLIIMGCIYRDPTRFISQHYFEVVMTVQEALTLLDRSTVDFCTPTIVGRVVEYAPAVVGSTIGYRHKTRWDFGYAAWRVPVCGSDYELEGWRSDTGEGRRQTDAFHAAINRAPARAA